MYPNPLIALSAYYMKFERDLKTQQQPACEPYPTTRWWVEQKLNHDTEKKNGSSCHTQAQAKPTTSECTPEQKAEIKPILRCQPVSE